MRIWLAAAILTVIGFTTAALIQDIQRNPRQVALALISDEVQELAKKSDYPQEDLWERAKTIGFSSAFVRPQNLSTLIDRGDALHFSRAEAQKWMVAGLVAAGSPLRPNALWVRDREVFAHVVRASLDRGVAISTQTLSNVWIINFPDSIDLPNFPIGFDPAALRNVMGAGFIPIFEADDARELVPLANQVAAADPQGDAVFVLGSGLWTSSAPSPVASLIGREHAQLAIFGFGAAEGRRQLRAYAQKLLLAGYAWATKGMSPVWRSVLGRGTRLLIVHLAPERGIEENLDKLRAIAGQLKAAGVALSSTNRPSGSEGQPSEILEAIRYSVAILFAVLGPLLAMRQGLHSLRRIWVWHRWRPASPVPEILAGLTSTVAVAVTASSVVYALLFYDQWRLGLTKAPWFLWTTLLPMGISVVSLYLEELRQWSPRLRRPMTYRGALILAAFGIGIWLLLSPRQMVHALNIGALTGFWNYLPSSFWWVGPRWREILVGYPCLTIGLWLYYRHIVRHSGHKEGNIPADPRPWFLAALLAPSGVLQVFGYARAPYGILVGQTFLGAGFGLIIGSAVIFSILVYRWALKRIKQCD